MKTKFMKCVLGLGIAMLSGVVFSFTTPLYTTYQKTLPIEKEANTNEFDAAPYSDRNDKLVLNIHILFFAI